MRQISLSFSSIEAKKHKIDTEKHDNIDNKDNGSFFPKKSCPPLLFEKHDNKRQQSFYSFPKMLSKVVLRCRQ